MTSCLLYSKPPCLSEKEFTLKSEFAPKGNKFFLLRIDPFSEGRRNNFDSRLA